MKTSAWGWLPARSEGIWRFGPRSIRPFVAAMPYLTVLALFVMFHLMGGGFATRDGLLFDLPTTDLKDGEATSLVALVTPKDRDTLVFFDDARYTMSDKASMEAFQAHLGERLRNADRKTLLVLADRRVAADNIAALADAARQGGSKRILFATRSDEEAR